MGLPSIPTWAPDSDGAAGASGGMGYTPAVVPSTPVLPAAPIGDGTIRSRTGAVIAHPTPPAAIMRSRTGQVLNAMTSGPAVTAPAVALAAPAAPAPGGFSAPGLGLPDAAPAQVAVPTAPAFVPTRAQPVAGMGGSYQTIGGVQQFVPNTGPGSSPALASTNPFEGMHSSQIASAILPTIAAAHAEEVQRRLLTIYGNQLQQKTANPAYTPPPQITDYVRQLVGLQPGGLAYAPPTDPSQ